MINVILLVNVAFFFLMGVTALARPANITAYFSLPGIPMDMRNEVRAVYGGFGIAVAGVLASAMQLDAVRSGALLTIGVALLGMAWGRAVSFAVDRNAGRWPVVFFGTEIVLGGSLLTALWMS